MLATMAKRKGSGSSGKKPQRSGVPLNAWIEEPIMQALEMYLDGTDPRVSKTAALESALKDFLKGKGFWPPPGSKS
ncbi:MAG: hypothetical protein U0797_30360 [Gemmataceae bacterium]